VDNTDKNNIFLYLCQTRLTGKIERRKALVVGN